MLLLFRSGVKRLFAAVLDIEHSFGHNRHMHRTYVCSKPLPPGAARVLLRIGLAAVLAAALAALLMVPAADADRGGAPTVSHVVQPGDTLWGLAAAHTPPYGDVRRTAALIRAANGMDSALITAGETVEIPVGESS